MTAAAANSVIPNDGAMSDFVGPFDVTSTLTGERYQVRFSHLWNGIATRHSDTVDSKFLVDGRAAIVGLAHTGFVEFRARAGRDLTDREASFVAAEYLRERLGEEDERPLYDVPAAELARLIEKIGIR
ncbi:MAG: hypothetical protein DMG31_18885 [Acidobacteria bacterium]|nr:MAG: hypothetical protein DMG31_18885 [Acidobacteriota bacterium]